MNAAPKRGEAARGRLEKAALRCFVKRGIDAATTKEIARLARMAEGNLYRHFPSKEDLAWALYEKHLGRFSALLTGTAASSEGTRARLEALVRHFRRLFEEDPDTYTYIVLAQHRLLRRVPKGLRTPTDIVAGVLAEGQRRGEVRKGSANLMAALLVGMVVRATLLKLHGFLEEDVAELEREVAEACWRVVAKQRKRGAR